MKLLIPLVTVSALGAAITAGVLFAFSTSVMPALAGRPSVDASATMQSINQTIVNPVFLLLFLGTSATCAATTVVGIVSGGRPGVAAAVFAVIFVVGVFGLTVGVNVPMNDKLAQLDLASPAAPQFWADYLSRWTRANHVRTAAAAVSAAGLLWAAIEAKNMR